MSILLAGAKRSSNVSSRVPCPSTLLLFVFFGYSLFFREIEKKKGNGGGNCPFTTEMKWSSSIDDEISFFFAEGNRISIIPSKVFSFRSRSSSCRSKLGEPLLSNKQEFKSESIKISYPIIQNYDLDPL